ncbi:MAG: glycoside hydrolase 43 family protein [Salinivirgaceae bacterium]|jgi:beta-xylosidase|nr:glycoside hydrolase 43 family protein [Salinivirgaceae bacterium]
MNLLKPIFFIIVFILLLIGCSQKSSNNSVSEIITYTNPILHLDYSDPDVVQVGSKYYMTASSFNCIPGLPLLESENLVDWELIGYAIKQLEPDSVFSKPQHGNGVWAPAIRYHNNMFYIYYGDPDFGIFVVTAKDIHGPWSKPLLVKDGKGWIDPCPFWDEDGTAWLVHAWAGSRAGVKSTLTLHKMSADGRELLDNGIIVFDGHHEHKTVEGPKMYKRNNYYYIFAPAGGVTEGWQLALRSKNVTGPYEVEKVLDQGATNINGPHQGAWVDAFDGSSWFFHFQDKGAFGRIVHLQPMEWINDWPVIGKDTDGDGIGEPVLQNEIVIQNARRQQISDSYSDEFNTPDLNLNWQWHANPKAKWGAPTAHLGYLRLNAIPFAERNSLWGVPNLLMQKFPSNNFIATTKIDIFLHEEGDLAGLLIMGYDYAYLAIEKHNDVNTLVYRTCSASDKGGKENTILNIPWNDSTVYFKTKVDSMGNCQYSYSANDENYTTIPESFLALPGKWIGAKVGLFCISDTHTNDAGYINVDWFRFGN